MNFILYIHGKIVLLHPSNAIAMRSENREYEPTRETFKEVVSTLLRILHLFMNN